MIRAFVCASILVTAFTCYSQTVTVQPSTISGFDIVGPQNPDFAAAVAETVGSDLPPVLKPWLPYGVVIKNNSLQPLAGICVVWTRDLNAGPLGYVGGPCATWLESRKPFQLQPGKTVLAFPDWILQEPGELKPFRDPKLLSDWRDGLANFQRAHTLAISLDSVVFASGQFVGPDATNQYKRFQAHINAPRNVATTLLEKKTTGTISDILTWLQTLAPQSHYVDDPDFNRRISGVTARAMLKVYEDKGEAALYLKAESTLQSPVFPLHQ
jgi:hypothetical protein